MKKLLWLGILIPSLSHGAYFRLIDIQHPQLIAGALLDPTDLNNTEVSSLIPLITHSPNDGCILPKLVCEDWSPLAVGGGMVAGSFTFVVAPVANVLPALQGLALAVTPAKYTGIRSILTPASGGAVTFSAGPAWEYKQSTNKGYIRVFTGLALKF